MKTQASPGAGGHKRKLPYLTEEELNEPQKAVVIRVVGKYTKRGEHRKEVYEDDYEADIIVPKKFEMGHVKLGVNRHVKKELKGIRARTYEVDTSVAAKPAEGSFKVRDFMSDMGIQDNERAKKRHQEKVAKARAEAQARASGTYVPPAFADTSEYGEDGLPPLRQGPAIDVEE